MFRMVAIGDYDDRYVIPKRHGEASPTAFADQGSCGVDFAGAGLVPDAEPYEPEPAASEIDLRDYLVRQPGNGGQGSGG
jgi:nitrate reductase beta subunit